MEVTGKIDLFKNKRGYVTGVLKSFNEEKKVSGKSFIDVSGVVVKEGETLTIDVKKGYLNSIHVEGEKGGFDKFSLSIKEYDVVRSYQAR